MDVVCSQCKSYVSGAQPYVSSILCVCRCTNKKVFHRCLSTAGKAVVRDTCYTHRREKTYANTTRPSWHAGRHTHTHGNFPHDTRVWRGGAVYSLCICFFDLLIIPMVVGILLQAMINAHSSYAGYSSPVELFTSSLIPGSAWASQLALKALATRGTSMRD